MQWSFAKTNCYGAFGGDEFNLILSTMKTLLLVINLEINNESFFLKIPLPKFGFKFNLLKTLVETKLMLR